MSCKLSGLHSPHGYKFMADRSNWTSRMGFILASAGAAVGLGAIWKFPYLSGSNGGSVFLFPYIVLSFTIGLPLLIAEGSMGRTGKGCIVTAYRSIAGKAWAPWGYLGVLTGFCVLCFYSAIGGWTISYLIDALLGNGLVADQQQLSGHFGALVSNPYISIGYQAAFLFLTAWVVAYDVSKGIERLSKYLMPLFFCLVLVIIVRGVTLPGAEKGLAYLFSWNPDAFTWESLLAAMGFTFFSLCVGCGCMLTYGSYLPKSANLVNSCAWITFLATFSSILGGLMIMPAVFAFGLDPTAGPGLTFMTMPVVFAQLPFGQFFAIVFYLCLVLAAITSSVSLLELVVAFVVDELKLKRIHAVTIVTAIMLVVGSFCGLSFGPLADFKIAGRTIFDNFDYFTSNLSLPVGGLVVCVLVGVHRWKLMREEIIGTQQYPQSLINIFRFMLTVACPVLILTVLISGL